MAKPAYPSDNHDKFMLRLPDGMRDRIRIVAEKNNRSMNAEIVATLEEKYPPRMRFEDDLHRLNVIINLIDEVGDRIDLTQEKREAEYRALGEMLGRYALRVEAEVLENLLGQWCPPEWFELDMSDPAQAALDGMIDWFDDREPVF